MKEERPIVRSGRRGSAALAVLAVFFTSVLSPATAEAAAKTTGKVEAALNPLEMGWIWDANVNRIPGGNSGDIIMSLSAGAEAAAMPVEGDVWEGRLEMNITGARYLQNPNYSNLTNRFSMAAEIRP